LDLYVHFSDFGHHLSLPHLLVDLFTHASFIELTHSQPITHPSAS